MNIQTLEEDVQALTQEGLRQARAADSAEAVERVRVALLGRKSALSARMKGLGALSAADKPLAGAILNDARKALEDAIAAREAELRSMAMGHALRSEIFDMTLPGRPMGQGRHHPIGMVLDELIEIFTGLGFAVEEGPEIETDAYNFQMLNFPDEHPARDMQDTFYVHNGARLLRTHTSPVQIHAMLRRTPPLSVIAPGRVFRCDSDVTHSPVFHHVEGFHVDRNVNFGHLKGALELFVHRLYGPKAKIRLRPSFFPFTEPSAEVDVSCMLCGGRGCRVCKNSGWLEILGAGMIDPNVFTSVNLDPEQWTGFAFGCGIERIAMLKYGIDDIRLLYENDPRFLERF